MLVRLFRLLILISLMLSLGLHWAILQSVAWVGMIANNSREASLSEAVSRTFDGQHPCSLCKIVKQGRHAEQNQDQQQIKSGLKIELGLVWETPEFHFHRNPEPIAAKHRFLQSRSEAPPRPFPRTHFV